MGYGQSKLVSEHIVRAAVETAGAHASILRIGQVVGDTKHGMWTDREAIPAIVRSALTMRVLPELKILCQWLPVDILADCIIEIGGLSQKGIAEGHDSTNGNVNTKFDGEPATHSTTDNELGKVGPNPKESDKSPMNLVYNLLSPHTFPWTSTLLPALRSTALPSFKTVPTENWLQRLRYLASSISSDDPAADSDKNPAIKLIHFYESAFSRDEERDGKVEFEIGESISACASLREVEDVVGSGLAGKMVGWWMERWEGKVEGKEGDALNDEDGRDGLKSKNEEVGLEIDESPGKSVDGDDDTVVEEVEENIDSVEDTKGKLEMVEEGEIEKRDGEGKNGAEIEVGKVDCQSMGAGDWMIDGRIIEGGKA